MAFGQSGKGFKGSVLGALVLLAIFSFIGWSIYSAYHVVSKRSVSTVDMVKDSFCEQKTVHSASDFQGKLVVLRLDDIQAFMWSEVSKTMISSAIDRGVPMVAGVIPKGIRDDIAIWNFLRRERCNIELALHGWDHGREAYTASETDMPAEFADLDTAAATELILKGKAEMRMISGEPMVTFIPPNNVASRGTEEALHEAGFKVLSSGGDGAFDYSVPTYDFTKKEIVSVDHIMTVCDRQFSSQKPCIIMFHPQEYSNEDRSLNQDAYEHHYLDLLGRLKDAGVTFVTFKDLAVAGMRDERTDVQSGASPVEER